MTCISSLAIGNAGAAAASPVSHASIAAPFRMTGIALGWIAPTTVLGAHVRNAAIGLALGHAPDHAGEHEQLGIDDLEPHLAFPAGRGIGLRPRGRSARS